MLAIVVFTHYFSKSESEKCEILGNNKFSLTFYKT